ncbi:glutathione S-transferase [Dokdonella sp.]|uniref:glutathione S-transferase n=1 Tax=Dokdonella sp. TaxID=2291710 RepID=UPI003783AF54
MIVVHHLNDSRSQRILWLLEELGQPYEIVRYQRDPHTLLAPASLRAVHPLGKSPVVVDGDEVLAESGAIIERLTDRYGNGRLAPPADSPGRGRYLYWLHYAEGSAMPPLLLRLVMDRIESAKMPFFVRPIAHGIVAKVRAGFVDPQLRLHMDYIDAELARNEWFAGDRFSAADVQMSFPLEAAAARGVLADRHVHARGWLVRIHARSAYQRALARGGDYAYASALA